MATSYDIPRAENFDPKVYATDYMRLTTDVGGCCSPDEEQEWFVLAETAAHALGALLAPKPEATVSRANLDLLTVYTPALVHLTDRVKEYENAQAAAPTTSAWIDPILAQLKAELAFLEARVEALYKAGFDG